MNQNCGSFTWSPVTSDPTVATFFFSCWDSDCIFSRCFCLKCWSTQSEVLLFRFNSLFHKSEPRLVTYILMIWLYLLFKTSLHPNNQKIAVWHQLSQLTEHKSEFAPPIEKMTNIPGSLAGAAKLEPGIKVCDKITEPSRQLQLVCQTHKRNTLLLWPVSQNYLALGLLQPWSRQLEQAWGNRSLISDFSPEQV